MDAKRQSPDSPMNGPNAFIPCCHGVVYTVSCDRLGARVDPSNAILGRLKKIAGVKVEGVRGRWADLVFPPIRLPDVTSVLVPTTSWRARAAHRGRLW